MVTHITQTHYYNQVLGEGQRLPVPYYGDSLLQTFVADGQKSALFGHESYSLG